MPNPFFQEMTRLGIRIQNSGFEDYLRDESRFTGHAEALIRATNISDVALVMKACNDTETPVTVVSGKTSLTGAPVPLGGVILDVKKLNSMSPEEPNKVGPGAVLKEYKEFVDSLGLFYPPDPTSESTCTIGGNVACNASGALSYLYGPTRDYVQGLKIVLPTGAVLNLDRERVFAKKGMFRIPKNLMDPSPNDDLVVPAPSWKSSPWKVLKNSAGFYSADNMDLVDLFIGSEGILGVFAQVTTKLLKRRRPFFSLIIYLPDQEATVRFVQALNLLRVLNSPFPDEGLDECKAHKIDHEHWLKELDCSRFRLILPSCMEWFGNSTSELLPEDHKKYLNNSYGAIFVEQEYENEDGMFDSASQWAELIEYFNQVLGNGIKKIQTQVVMDVRGSRAFRLLRQSIPEKLNELIHPGFVKIGSDFSVPSDSLKQLLDVYDEKLPLDISYLFGHIGNSHLHANILPQTNDEEKTAQRTMDEIARTVVSMGGSIAGEHGIGKIKSKYLEMALGEEAVRQMKRIKRSLDPRNILNRHTLLGDLNL
jgi:D-lactate dehydrogenase (cytochrome)